MENSAINKQHLPSHIAIIMDGNGRWAQSQGKDRLYGHFHGVESVRNIVEGAAELGIQYLTLYAFSTENWDRPQKEVDGLMELLVDTIRKEVSTLNKNNIKLHIIGDRNMLPKKARVELDGAMEDTAKNDGMNLVMALSYSSRWEIEHALTLFAKDVESGKVSSSEVNANTLQQYLETKNFPDPELLIRTGGEHRVSNFLLYQIAYSELYFTNTMWPDFKKENLYAAIADFQSRQRRFGKIGEQLKP